MDKEFVPYKESLELKKLGFDEPCFGYYIELVKPIEGILTIEQCDKNVNGCCIAPTFSQAFRFFREKYGDFLRYDWGVVPHFLMIQIEMTKGKTYEEAELACLRKLIEIFKEK